MSASSNWLTQSAVRDVRSETGVRDDDDDSGEDDEYHPSLSLTAVT